MYVLVREKHECVDFTRVSPLVEIKISVFTVGQVTLKVASRKVVRREKTCSDKHVFISFMLNTFDFLIPEDTTSSNSQPITTGHQWVTTHKFELVIHKI